MALLGMDVDAARDLSRQMNTTAEQFVSAVQTLTSALGVIEWLGNDAQMFRSNWEQAAAQINGIADMLRDQGMNLNRQAEEQERVSSA